MKETLRNKLRNKKSDIALLLLAVCMGAAATVHEVFVGDLTVEVIAGVLITSAAILFEGAVLGFLKRDFEADQDMELMQNALKDKAFRDVLDNVESHPEKWAPFEIRADEKAILCRDEAAAALVMEVLQAAWSGVHTGRCDTGEFEGWYYIRES